METGFVLMALDGTPECVRHHHHGNDWNGYEYDQEIGVHVHGRKGG